MFMFVYVRQPPHLDPDPADGVVGEAFDRYIGDTKLEFVGPFQFRLRGRQYRAARVAQEVKLQGGISTIAGRIKLLEAADAGAEDAVPALILDVRRAP